MHDSNERDNPIINRRSAITGAAALGLGGLAATAMAQTSQDAAPPEELFVLWTSADPDVAHRVCLMYAHAAKQYAWFPRVRLVIWGPSQRTFVGDKDLRAKVAEMRDDGVVVQACIACALSFGLVETIREMGYEVLPMGEPLSNALADPRVRVLSF